MGWRQQRFPLLRLRPADRGRRPAPPRARSFLPPRRDQCPLRGCLRDQQSRYRQPRGRSLRVRENLRLVNPKAIVIEGASPLFVDDPAAIQGKRVLVIEDGPTLTHGEMAYGAGWVAARRFGAAEIIDPAPLRGRLRSKPPTKSIPAPARFCRRWATATARRKTWSRRSMPLDCRPGDHRHAHRSDPHHQDQQALPARALRAAGDRSADPGRYSESKVRSKSRSLIRTWRRASQHLLARPVCYSHGDQTFPAQSPPGAEPDCRFGLLAACQFGENPGENGFTPPGYAGQF